MSQPSSTHALAPATIAELRKLLQLQADAEDEHFLAAVSNLRRLTDAALEIGFSRTFTEAVAEGRADPLEREFWAERFYRDPDTAREDLARDWRNTA